MNNILQTSGVRSSISLDQYFNTSSNRFVLIAVAALTLIAIAFLALRLCSNNLKRSATRTPQQTPLTHTPPINVPKSKIEISEFLEPINEKDFANLPQSIQLFRREIESYVSKMDSSHSMHNLSFRNQLACLIIKCHFPYSQWNRQYPFDERLLQPNRDYTTQGMMGELEYPNNRLQFQSERDYTIGRISHRPENDHLLTMLHQLTPILKNLIIDTLYPSIFELNRKILNDNEIKFLLLPPPPMHFEDDDVIEVIQLKYLYNGADLEEVISFDILGASKMLAEDVILCRSPEEYFKRRGLVSIPSSVDSLEELQSKIEANGSAIVTTGIHQMDGRRIRYSYIVDAIKNDRVEIRDHYHGWKVAITREAFLKDWAGDTLQILQARKPLENEGF